MSGLSPDLYYEPSPPLVIQARHLHYLVELAQLFRQLTAVDCSQDDSGALQNDTVDEVWVHPESLAMLDGAILPGTPSDAQVAPIVALWSLVSESTTQHNAPTESVRYYLGCSILKVFVDAHAIP